MSDRDELVKVRSMNAALATNAQALAGQAQSIVSEIDTYLAGGGGGGGTPPPVDGVVILTATTNPPAPTPGGSGKYTWQANVTYACLGTDPAGNSLSVDTSSGMASANCEVGASPVAGDWAWAEGHTFEVPSSGFPITYQPYARGQASGSSLGISRPPANCIPPFPQPFYWMWRFNETGEAIVQLSLGAS